VLVHNPAVAQHEPDRSGDLAGIDVLLHDAVDAREPIGRKGGRRLCRKNRRGDDRQRER